MSYNIKYNKAIEFISAILKYTRSKSHEVNWNIDDIVYDPANSYLDLVPSKEVKDWLKYVDENIPPFLRNDILFLVNKLFGVMDVCFNLVMDKNLSEPMEIIEEIEKIDSSKLVEMTLHFYHYYHLDDKLEDNDIVLKNAIAKENSEEIDSCFIQIKKYPNEYKKHFIESFTSFYNLFFLPFEEQTYSYMEKMLMSHIELSEKDPINFINTIGFGDYSKVLSEYDEIKLFVSYYLDHGLFYFAQGKSFPLLYGKTIEHRFNKIKMQDTYKALFKALSDDKRIEIIKITSKRPWYNKELADYFNLTTATLSYHLNLLLDLGLLHFEPSINNRYYYTTNKENLKKIFDMALKDLFG
ncbi:ArsR family transcriptional regulator [Alkaliphilus peptidifermentans]|uniref:DNA-binding transcriptional regulator, ArsR family n=1 Tax=Alkaliphilus peptidifermentans DSM 18978 TaxID=1120976 RepID=A0A1G5AYU3_9FIRM|nr:ArsR family transcriptional regulator [Alkaliphilus peptidifermentans]SCX83022.1 DNA-binding transcriptional regulator, ArsR family [Alkaliphilus peptidifermentans DSM 18978]